MAYRKQVAMRRVTYVPNNLTSGAIKKLAHFLTDNGDNRFMIVLDGSTATGKTTLMTAMRQALRWLTDHRLVSDDIGLRILDATKICTLMDSSRDWNELLNWPSYLGIEDLGCEPAEILRWGNPLYPVSAVQKQIEGFRKKGYLDRRDDGSWHVLALNSRVE